MKKRRSNGWWMFAVAAACVGAAIALSGCGRQQSVLLVPVSPAPVPISLDEIVAKAKAGESEWALIWAVRQSRRAWPLTTADVGRLREAGVSDRVMDFMLETVTAARLYCPVPMTVEEVVGLKAAGVPDDRVIAEMTWTGTIFHLKTADVVALREQGVSDKVIDFMLYTRQLERGSPVWYTAPEVQ
jgi:hypothetical protein